MMMINDDDDDDDDDDDGDDDSEEEEEEGEMLSCICGYLFYADSSFLQCHLCMISLLLDHTFILFLLQWEFISKNRLRLHAQMLMQDVFSQPGRVLSRVYEKEIG